MIKEDTELKEIRERVYIKEGLSKRNCTGQIKQARKNLFEMIAIGIQDYSKAGRETELNSEYSRDSWGFVANRLNEGSHQMDLRWNTKRKFVRYGR